MYDETLVQRALRLLSQPIETVKPKETLTQQALTQRHDTGSTIQPGALITWTRQSDGSVQEGLVDFLHTDDRGARWVFVSLFNGTWAALNLKHLRESGR